MALTAAGLIVPYTPPFVPDATFFAGASGFAYDPSDYSTMFQDSGGATPVTGTGQSLGRINDLSGNGNNRTMATSSRKPQTATGGKYTYDNFDDGMEGAANTASAGAWTYLAKVGVGADTTGILLVGSVSGIAHFGVYESGSGAATSSNAPITSMTVDAASVADTRSDLLAALAGAPHELVLKMSSLTDGQWLSVFNTGGIGGYEPGSTIGREILIQRDLTGAELTNAVAWINS